MTTKTENLSLWSRLGNIFNTIANPSQFLKYSAVLIPFFGIISLIGFAIGLYITFFKTPLDEEMGQTVIIMFVHVPAAWIAMMSYAIVATSSIGLLIWRHPLADVSAKAAAPRRSRRRA